ncbi:PAS domain-containing sensor histidine kinase [Hymenobacter siberiensis]|uniref:PAS domain-containing sensor histidine kinase n=1 Tax=Hymenobacter siberiensis TaxID=2848396 RepID=UPI001C1E59CE|nr:PAS domain-containing protein [Hymenobacter siberiensis]MBU6119436.1 PAS domain-containing protein [Hymenobacter siberiensis]
MSFATPPALDFELLFSLLPAPHGVLAPDGTVLHLNAAMVALLPAGTAPDALIGQPLAVLRAAAEAGGAVLAASTAWAPALAAALAGTAQVLMPAPVPSGLAAPHGYWQATLQPIPPPQARYVLLRLLDVTPQLHSQLVAEQEQERFRFLAESLPQLVWATNAQGEPDYTNQRFLTYTGHDVLQMSEAEKAVLWQQIIHPDDLAGMYARWGEALHNAQPFELEFRMRGVAGEYRWFLSQVVAQRGADGQVQRWFGLCTDIDARYRAQVLMDDQQRHMQRILDQLPLTITSMEAPDFRFTFLSARARESMGSRASIGTTVAESLPEIADQGYLQLLQQVVATGQPVLGHEERSILTDPTTGELREYYNNFGYLPLAGEPGAAPGVLAYSLDVTEQVQARQRSEALLAEARAADQRLRHVTESLPSITFISDQTGQVLYLSPQWYAYTGTQLGDDLANAWTACLHPDDSARVATEYAVALAAGTPWHYELRLRRHDGEYRWFMSQGVPEPLADAVGHARQWFGSDLDIHELHEARYSLEVKDRQLSQILAQAPAFIATFEGPDHRYSFFNAGYYQLMSPRPHLGQPVAEVQPEVARQGFLKLLDRVYQTGQPFVGHEMLIRLPGHHPTESLTEHYLDLNLVPLRDNQDRVYGVLSFALEVTERVHARQHAEALAAEMNRRNEQVNAITASVPVFIFNFDPSGYITYTNPYFYEYTGLSPAAAPNAAWDFLPPDDRAAVSTVAQAAMAAGEAWQATFRCRRHDGELRWFQTKVQPYTNAAGQLAGFSAATVEIHDLHERTEELTRSRTDFAALADNMAQLAWMADATGHIFWYNQRWYDYTGATFETMQGEGWQAVHAPTLLADINARYQVAIQAGQPWEDTFPLRRHDGEYRWFLSRARPIRDEATGAVVRWFGTNTDVTELRHLQTQLAASEEEQRIQVESIPQQVWTARPDGTVDFYNHRTAAYLGEAMEKNGAAEWLSFVHPDDRAPMEQRWQAAIASQRYYEAEFRLRRYDGQYRWFLGQAQARRAPGGHILKWYGTNTDVHQQRVLQEQVLASQARFKQLLETLPQLAWTARPDGSINYYNQRWYDLLDTSFEELKGWGWEQFIHPDDLTGTLRHWHHSLRTGETFTNEHRWRDKQGHYRWFMARGEAIRDAHGEVVLWVGTNTDVHDLKQAQHQLESQNARLRRTNEDLDNFIYTASHDLKQPINNMAGIFEELTRTAYFRDPDAIKLINYFERALARIYATIDDLSAIVQVQRQQQEMPAEAVSLSQLTDEILASLHDQITQTGATFALDFATYPVVTFVRLNLQSVLFNLISNSLKYAAPGRPPRIRLSSTPDALTGRPTLTVQDNGLGIDLDRFGPQLFQLFRRFHPQVDGTGMGLYLVNRIVQNHGGRLEVSSKVDEGTTFQIYL